MRRISALPVAVLVAVLVVLIAAVVLRAAAPSSLSGGRGLAAGSLPDPALTPGDVLTTDPGVICRPGYTQTVRNVPGRLKAQVYRSYGITARQPGEFEVDHLISLELAGSNSVRNLWPESYVTTPLNAHVKDALENRLHALACKGRVPLQEAQRAMASDWTAAYVRYVGPLPTR
jgi:hypothetical protein